MNNVVALMKEPPGKFIWGTNGNKPIFNDVPVIKGSGAYWF